MKSDMPGPGNYNPKADGVIKKSPAYGMGSG